MVTEIDPSLEIRTVRFRLKSAFSDEAIDRGRIVEGVVHREPSFRVSIAFLDHRTLCLGFTIEECAHLNVWKNRHAELGLPVGPWLRELKRAVIENTPDEHPIRIGRQQMTSETREVPLAALRTLLTPAPGQKIAYVTDAADTAANRRAIIKLVQNADLLFIEAAFAEADVGSAAERAHLTTAAAGRIAPSRGPPG